MSVSLIGGFDFLPILFTLVKLFNMEVMLNFKKL